MNDRKSTTPAQVKSDKTEHPKRGPEPDTLEGPGDRHESEGVSDGPDNVGPTNHMSGGYVRPGCRRRNASHRLPGSHGHGRRR